MSQSDVILPSELSIEDGVYLVRLARKAIEEYIKKGIKMEPDKLIDKKFMRRGMAFVTIERIVGTSEKELRGCIGFLQPISSLARIVIESAIAAATEDPRFPPLKEEELENIVIEVSILSPPMLTKNPMKDIIIGKHGIIISRGWNTGTLLPQVPIDYCWDVETFLAEGCLKAGLEPDCWYDNKTKIFIYEGRIFYEEKPYGDIKERDLASELSKKCKY
ncbi:TIGR00296 family protein [Ignisphaera sp. 4213-co]|uniref:Protein QPL79_07950 n=1 Tax=Ignisphaera cupida TaxID=3050454 RepID=A0ABD4Z8E1_9CREN|nr:TIGR00296 family protein [Ignisphaera sp. 4213-co]MDK6029292.1 TIGR00296 family protein [Ignisphaera sp. 4213-co]